MKYKLNVGTAAQYQAPETNEDRIVVPFEIVDESGTVVFEHKESFPITATEDEIREVLARHLTVFEEDTNRHETVKDRQEKADAAQEVTANISNITL